MKSNKNPKNQLFKRLTGYSAAATSLLVLSQNATAQIHYSGEKNLVFGPDTFDPHMVDLNTDGIVDFGFINFVTSSSYTSMGYDVMFRQAFRFAVDVRTDTYNSWMVAQTASGPTSVSFALPLDSNSGISSMAGNWGNQGPQGILEFHYGFYVANSTTGYSTVVDYGDFDPGEENILGIRFFIGAMQHYGWMRIMNSRSNELIIRDWAYNTDPNEGMLAGLIVPEFDNDEFYSNLNVEIGVGFTEPVDNIAPEDFIVDNGSINSISTVTPGEQYTLSITAASEGIVTVSLPVGSITHNEKAVGSAMTQFVVHNVLDLDNVPSETARIYPNPASDILHMEFAEASNVDVISLDGQTLLQLKNIQQNELDVSALSPGVYMLRIHNPSGTITLRFVRQ